MTVAPTPPLASIPIVVDASVALKLVLAEEFTDRAQALLRDSLQARRPLVAPPHLHSEVINALYQRLRRRTITEDEANQAVTQFLRFPITLSAPADLYQQAFTFAGTAALPTIYDSLYVVLAQFLGAELWTDDRRLRTALGTTAPWVRWIGDYPLP